MWQPGGERVLLACDAEGVFTLDSVVATRPLHAYVIDTAGGESAVALTAELRRAGLRADRAFDGRSMKSQFKSAARSGALVALVVLANLLRMPNPVWLAIALAAIVAIDVRWRGMIADAADQLPVNPVAGNGAAG